MNRVQLDLARWKHLRAELGKFKKARVRVGVLKGAPSRADSDKSNAEIGFYHEFGSNARNLPARSWLRMPLYTVLPKRITRVGRDLWRSMVEQGDTLKALQSLGVVAEGVVQEAFSTNGFGRWAPWSKRYALWRLRRAISLAKPGAKVSVGNILVLSGQLRRAVSSRVVP